MDVSEGHKSKYPLNCLVQAWHEKLRLAKKFKKASFQDDADVAMRFFVCGKELNELIWEERLRATGLDDGEDELPAPRFRMLIGKVAELVQLFGPALYHRNPTIIVEQKTLDIPLDLLMQMVPPEMMQQAQMAAQQQGQQFTPQSLFPPDPEEAQNKLIALLLQYYLDYMQRENDKKTHSRRMIDEALIKGAGVLWTEKYEPYEGGPTLIGSFHDTIDNLFIDPDCEVMDEAEWIARKRVWPIWKVADHFDIDYDYLFKKYGGTHESLNSQGETVANRRANEDRKIGKTNDLMEFYEIYSKMGMGHKLAGIDKNVEGLYDLLDSFGPYCHICIAKDVPYPLNLKQADFRKALNAKDTEKAESLQEDRFMDVQWPIPFWSDGSWPMTVLAFHEVPNNPWPMSHIKPGLCYLEFITWCMSFLVNHIRTSCRTVVSCMKTMDDTMKSRITAGKDFTLLEIPNDLVPDGDVQKAVHFLQMPPVNKDIWEILDANSGLFEKSTGLNDLLYAATGGFRSAQEVSVKSTNANVRPDDMANKVEDMLSLVARKEAMAARWLLDAESVMPVLGKRGTGYWEQYVMSTDIEKVSREFHYRVEAGSTRKPNKETRVAQITAALQQWAPVIQWSLASLGQNQDAPRILNAYTKMWCEANDVESKEFMFSPPPPPPPNPMIQKVQAEIQQGQQELQMKQQESQMKMQFEQQKLELEKEKSAMELQVEQMKTQADMQKAAVDLKVTEVKSQQEMQIAKQKADQEMQLGHMNMLGDMQIKKQEIGAKQQEMQLNADQKMQEMQLGAAQKKQELQQGAQQHKQQLAHEKQAGQQKIKISSEQSKAKIQQTKAQAKAKPKPKGKK